MKNLLILIVCVCSGCTVVSQNRAFPKMAFAWTKDAKLEREYRRSEKEYIEHAKRKAELSDTLKRRDTQALDLAKVGKDLVSKYGKVEAEKLVLEMWSDLTAGASTEKAKDVMWLQDQQPRVRDVGWLVSYRAEWL